MAKIFGEFEQVDGASNRKFEGTGLGLAISNKLATLMEGRIDVTSAVGEGSEFSIHLSLPTSSEVPIANQMLIGDMTGKRVLIVDDLAINRTILSERLRYWNVSSHSVSSGKQALEALINAEENGQHFDLAILDFQMPVMDGCVLASKIRKMPVFADLPLILLSSVDQSVNMRSRREIDFAEVLLKPVRATVLKDAILTTFSKSGLDVQKTTPRQSGRGSSATTQNTPLRFKGLSVLVAEDNMTNQLVLKNMLKKTGLKIKMTNNGEEAVAAYKQNIPDAIFMDMSMPKMDGLEATRAIRKIEKVNSLPACPIIALTANAMENDRQLCLDAGMDDYLSKPLVKARLIDCLASWTQTHSQKKPRRSVQADKTASQKLFGSVDPVN